MKKIEQWEDFDRLTENPKKAIVDYACEDLEVHRNYSRGCVIGTVGAVGGIGTAVSSYLVINGAVDASGLYGVLVWGMWLVLVGDIAIFAIVAGMWRRALVRRQRMKTLIAEQYGIDVTGINIMKLKTGYELRIGSRSRN